MKKLYETYDYKNRGSSSIREQIKKLEWKWDQAMEAAKKEFDGYQKDALNEFEYELHTAQLGYMQTLSDKEQAWLQVSRDNADAFKATAAQFQAEFDAERHSRLETINSAFEDKKAQMQASYEDVSEQISHIYDYHLQHRLQEALDQAKQEADDTCAQKHAVVEARDANIVARFDEGSAAQAAKNAEADETNKNLCDAALAEQGARFGEFIEESGAKFEGTQADDRETFWLNIQHADSKFNEGKKAYYVRHETTTKTRSYRSHYGHRYRKTSRYVTHKPFFFSDKDIDFELQPLLDGIDDSLNNFEGDVKTMKMGLLDSAQEDSKVF